LTLDYQRLQLIEQQIAMIEAEQAKELKAAHRTQPGSAAEASAISAARLAELRGIGPIGGLVLRPRGTLLHGYANPLKKLDISESVNLYKYLILLDSCRIHATRWPQTESRGGLSF
jgi:hypothetical protein